MWFTTSLVPLLFLVPALAAPVVRQPILVRQSSAVALNGNSTDSSDLSKLLAAITTSTNATGLMDSIMSGIESMAETMKQEAAKAGGILSDIGHDIEGLFGDDSSDNSTNTASTVPLSSDIANSAFLRSAQFTQVSYCSTAAVTSWTCGPPCDDLPGVKVITAGGNNAQIPGFFVAYDPTGQQVVVAHQGTNSQNIISIANDAEFAQVPLNQTLFPKNWSNDTKVHEGFQDTQGRTADIVLSTVQSTLQAMNTKNVLVAGHSLGAAIAVMDAMMLSQNLPSDVNINTVVFGLPRGGNQDWADLVDATLAPQFAHVSNQNDPVPTVPPEFLEYVHPVGEVHVTDSSFSSVNCPGAENENCSAGNKIEDVDVDNHLGPYFRSDIIMSHEGCPL